MKQAINDNTTRIIMNYLTLIDETISKVRNGEQIDLDAISILNDSIRVSVSHIGKKVSALED